MMKLQYPLVLAVVTLSSCSLNSSQKTNLIAQRLPAAIDECPSFNNQMASDKLKLLMDRHAATATNPFHDEILADAEAAAATAKFLIPDLPGLPGLPGVKDQHTVGHESLDHTLILSCDTLPKPFHAKMVHALGTLAQAHLVLYPKLKKLSGSIMTDEVDSPYTGLLDPKKNEGTVPVLLRFSIANPLVFSADFEGKSFAPEFIPGLGLKFLVDKQKSIDLLAMESLAGQSTNHNYFKYEFSPDFSAQAPRAFNTAADGDAKNQILARYASNYANEKVMGLVGERFLESMQSVYPRKDYETGRHSSAGPNPFIVSLQGLARVDKTGQTYSSGQQRRPWRLVFKPALDNIDGKRVDQITSEATFSIFHRETDFRAKLSYLKSGDRVYYVLAETKDGTRYALGEIVLDSSPSPSSFADREFFVQHEMDFDRSGDGAGIVEPN